MNQRDFRLITGSFKVQGEFLDATPYGNGHIHDTYLVSTTSWKYILQKINNEVFHDVERMNQNIIKALGHLHDNQRRNNKYRFRKLSIITCIDGKNYYQDDTGNYWRLMDFIADSLSFDIVGNTNIAYEAAKAYGYFQKNLADLDPCDFFPVIENFHNLEVRMQSFRDVLNVDPLNRKQDVPEEIEFAESHQHLVQLFKSLLESERIPLRVTHNDTKINNVLFDRETLKGVAVIDLDTIMSGTLLFDFGDMVRTFTSASEEDEKDLSQVVLREEIFEAIAKGYMTELNEVITEEEINNLVNGGKIMTFMIGLRFLTDFLEGDVYYKTSRKNHNLDRCRAQFKLLKEIEEKEYLLNQIIKNA